MNVEMLLFSLTRARFRQTKTVNQQAGSSPTLVIAYGEALLVVDTREQQ